MQFVYIWQVKATLRSTRTSTTYDIDSKIVTKEKSFSEAEKTGLNVVKKVVQEEKSHCVFDGLDEIKYIGSAGTLITET
jgi:hypothetical protein